MSTARTGREAAIVVRAPAARVLPSVGAQPPAGPFPRADAVQPPGVPFLSVRLPVALSPVVQSLAAPVPRVRGVLLLSCTVAVNVSKTNSMRSLAVFISPERTTSPGHECYHYFVWCHFSSITGLDIIISVNFSPENLDSGAVSGP